MPYFEEIVSLPVTPRIERLKKQLLEEPRYLSLEQALLITESYKKDQGKPRIIQRANALCRTLENISIRIDEDELIVGNRTVGMRGGVVSPEAGISWLEREIDTLETRPQDPFHVREEDKKQFKEVIVPFWKGNTLEDSIGVQLGEEIKALSKAVKINQTDHAQGHICPNVEKWLKLGPAGLKREAEEKKRQADPARRQFYDAVITVLDGSCRFIRRYGEYARQLSRDTVALVCLNLSASPPSTFREACQSVWFLFVLLEMESNASSFSPGRIDQLLISYLLRDLDEGRITIPEAQELTDALWIKFNQIVYMRSSSGAKYFAGFPIGFNIAVGGQHPDGSDAVNELSYLCLQAQRHLLLPQPNLSVRIHENSPDRFLKECARVIGLGGGMPQIFNDESIIPALENQGIRHEDAVNYAVVGCVELSTPGNNLGWSDAAMFNLVKVLELTLNNGKCLLTGDIMAPRLGTLEDFATLEDLEEAYKKQLNHFIDRMIKACARVDQLHAEILPSPLLSSVVDSCLENGIDVTAGGAVYNLSGIQAIQAANIADSFAVLNQLVYQEEYVTREEFLKALRADFSGYEHLRQRILHRVPKYGNDVEWVDNYGGKWISYFADKLSEYTNVRGGPYHTGLYTVSAHVPMGANVGAGADGRKAREPLADGGLSAMYGRDTHGPTALLQSVSRINSLHGSNGTLLNMKFLPEFFSERGGIAKFVSLLKGFMKLKIHHVQFNVIRREDLEQAREHPEAYRGLVVRVAGYTAYFTELAEDIQQEIIARTSFA